MHLTCGNHQGEAFLTKSGHFGAYDDPFRGQKARFGNNWGLKTVYLLKNGPLGAPRGPRKVQKWASDPYPVNLGRFNHYVVPGTKSGAVQVFQMGKTCSIGFS